MLNLHEKLILSSRKIGKFRKLFLAVSPWILFLLAVGTAFFLLLKLFNNSDVGTTADDEQLLTTFSVTEYTLSSSIEPSVAPDESWANSGTINGSKFFSSVGWLDDFGHFWSRPKQQSVMENTLPAFTSLPSTFVGRTIPVAPKVKKNLKQLGKWWCHGNGEKYREEAKTTLVLDFSRGVTVDIPVNKEIFVAQKHLLSLKYQKKNKRNRSEKVDGNSSSRWTPPEAEHKVMPEFNRFLFAGPMFGGLGNQMFKFASLYALGMALNRTLVYLPQEKVVRKMEREIAETFPAFYQHIYYANPNCTSSNRNSSVARVLFGEGCCEFYNPGPLYGHRETFLELTGDVNFESYRFFHPIREHIRDIFRCSPKIFQRLESFRGEMFRTEEEKRSHKLCVHTRLGDYVAAGGDYASNASQVEAAIEHSVARLNKLLRWRSSWGEKKQHGKNGVSVVLLGEEKDFLKNLYVDRKSVKGVHITGEMSRGEEMCFAVNSCDSLLITARVSTFGFWISYLMPSNAPIFFIGPSDYPHLLPEWEAITPRAIARAQSVIEGKKKMEPMDNYHQKLWHSFLRIKENVKTKNDTLFISK